jgi:DNA-binding IclR family transcriptional regulator
MESGPDVKPTRSGSSMMAGRPPKQRTGEDAAAEQRVEAVERALSLLDAFTEAEPALNLSGLAKRAGLYPSTALRLCGSLERCGYLARDGRGFYRPGGKLKRLARLHDLAFPLGSLLRPALVRLAESTGETAAFYVREGDRRICLYRVNGPRPVRSHLDEGAVLPLDRGAAGHVLMAFDGGTSPRHNVILRDGFSVSRGERDTDSAAIAIPLFDADGVFRGALGLAGPITRFGDEDIPPMLDALRAEAGVLGGR